MESAEQLYIINLYFLLHLRESTLPRVKKQGKCTTITIQFQVDNIGFWRNGSILPRQYPLHFLQKSYSATINTTNQKNEQQGQLIRQEALSNGKTCPVQALEEQVHHILSNGGINYNIIAVVHSNGVKTGINPQQISKKIKSPVRALGI